MSSFSISIDLFAISKRAAIQLVSQNGMNLEMIPQFNDSKKVVLAAVSQNGHARKWASSRLQADEDVIKETVKTFIRCKAALSELPSLSSSVPGNNRVFIGTRLFMEFLDESFKDTFVPAKKIRPAYSAFIRDSHVVLLNKVHLIPYVIKDEFFWGQFLSILPSCTDHFISSNISCVPSGNGFDECNINQAIIAAEEYRIPYKLGKTVIEGGNCYLFYDGATPRAVIGELSIYTSLIGLEEQGYFTKNPPLLSDEEPSLEAYRAARNHRLYLEEKRDLDVSIRSQIQEEVQQAIQSLENVFGGEKGYRLMLVAKVTEEDKSLYKEGAREFEAKLRMTKALIAEELSVPLQHIAFVPQRDFHIDMDLFVTPDGTVCMHDDSEAIQFLREIKQGFMLHKTHLALLDRYSKTAHEQHAAFKDIQARRLKILQDMGFRCKLLPGVFQGDDTTKTLNYCNGIFIAKEDDSLPVEETVETDPESMHKRKFLRTEKSYHFVTTGPTKEEEGIFHHEFLRMFRKAFPRITPIGVPGMSEFISSKKGGMHCLTVEN